MLVARVGDVPPLESRHRLTNWISCRATSRSWVLFMHNPVKFSRQRTVVGFIQRGFPDDNGWMVAVPPDHLARILINTLLENLVPNELPARVRNNRQNAQLIAGI